MDVAAGNSISKADLIAWLAELKRSILNEMKKYFDVMNGKLDEPREAIGTHGERPDPLEDHPETCQERLAEVEANITRLKSRLADIEGRSRRNNVRIIGLPEGIEGPQPSRFFPQMLQDVFGPDIFPSPPDLERAHRSRAPEPGPGGKPRPVILGFLRYNNKELVIREARKRGELRFHNNSFRIYEDYSPDVVTERKKYNPVMSELYRLGLKPALLFPARLRIINNDGTRTAFTSVAEAERFAEDYKKS